MPMLRQSTPSENSASEQDHWQFQGSRPFRRFVLLLLLEWLPDGFIANKIFRVWFHLARLEKARLAFWNLDYLLLLSHNSPLIAP